MELRVLRYFLTIAQEENFTRAAEQLHLTQPTLSRQIAQLEEELGAKLFLRGTHTVVLTEEGLLLRRRAQELLSLADKAKQEILSQRRDLEGVISIGCGEFLSTTVLADCIAAFRKDNPRVRFHLFSGNRAILQEKIEQGLLDMGVILCPFNTSRYDFIEMPVKEQWGVLMREDSPLARQSRVTPRELDGMQVISALTDFTPSSIEQFLGIKLPHLDVIARGNLLYNEAMLARSNNAAVVTIQLHCQYEGLRFIPFAPAVETATALIWKKNQTTPAAVSAFLVYANQYLKGIESDIL